MIASVRVHTDAVLAALRAAGLTVGDAQAPAGTPPYAVLYEIPGGRVFGTLGSPHDDARLVYQVTCVGKTREQAGWVADKSMTLLDLFPVVSRSVTFVDVDMPGIIRDDKESPPLFYSTPRFTITSTPA